jgi:hypothetical protein
MTDDDQEKRAREAVQRVLRKEESSWLFSKEGNREVFRGWLERKDVGLVVTAAKEGDADAVDVLRDIARDARRANVAVPPKLQEFALECFIDGVPKAQSGPSRKDTVTRNQAIAMLVKVVHEDFGFPKYRNADWRGRKGGPMTAIRLVAEEMGMEERTVEDILTNSKPSA